MLLGFEKYIVEREKELEKLAEEMRQQKRLVPLENRLCKICGKVWLKHRKFFFHAVYKGRNKPYTSWHFAHVCAICTAKQRHKKKVVKYEKKYSQPLTP